MAMSNRVTIYGKRFAVFGCLFSRLNNSEYLKIVKEVVSFTNRFASTASSGSVPSFTLRMSRSSKIDVRIVFPFSICVRRV